MQYPSCHCVVGLLTWREEGDGGSNDGSSDGNGSDEAMRGWLIALQLMQDDDEDIRDIASQAITLSSRIDNTTGTGSADAGGGRSGVIIKSSMSEPLPMVHGRVLEIMGERVGHVLSWCINSDHTSDHSDSGPNKSDASTSSFPQSVVRTLNEINRLLGALVG